MKIQNILELVFISILLTLSGCAVIGGIFKAGVGFGIFLVILVIALIFFVISKVGKGK